MILETPFHITYFSISQMGQCLFLLFWQIGTNFIFTYFPAVLVYGTELRVPSSSHTAQPYIIFARTPVCTHVHLLTTQYSVFRFRTAAPPGFIYIYIYIYLHSVSHCQCESYVIATVIMHHFIKKLIVDRCAPLYPQQQPRWMNLPVLRIK